MPVYKDGKRVVTYKVEFENDENGELSFAEISVKKAEIGNYKHVKYIESQSGLLDTEEVMETFYNYVKKGVKRLGIDPEKFIASEGKEAVVSNMAIFDDDEYEERGNHAVSYWSKYRIAKINGNRAVWFSSLISEDLKVVRSFYDAGAELLEVEEISMDTEDPFSFVKHLGIDVNRALDDETEEESGADSGQSKD